MRLRKALILWLCLCGVWLPPLFAASHLQYQSRGNRYEGVKPKPVSGFDVELISARVDYAEATEELPEYVRVKFYLDKPSEVYLVVRELEYEHYYWLDKVKGKQPWKPGFHNTFAWPTDAVIRHLDGLRLSDLGIVARLGTPEPSTVERVAPVILYHTQYPTTIQGYLFTFKTSSDAHLTWSVYRQDASEPIATQIIRRQRGGRPFTVRWDSTHAPEGDYTLIVEGYFLDTNAPLDQTVRFYHRPHIR